MAQRKSNRRRPKKRKSAKKRKTTYKYEKPSWLALILFWPYQIVAFLARNFPTWVRRPLKLVGAAATAGLFFLGALAIVYGVRAAPFDLAQVRTMPTPNLILDRYGNRIGQTGGENRTIVPPRPSCQRLRRRPPRPRRQTLPLAPRC